MKQDGVKGVGCSPFAHRHLDSGGRQKSYPPRAVQGEVRSGGAGARPAGGGKCTRPAMADLPDLPVDLAVPTIAHDRQRHLPYAVKH